jgi:tetratricopeptide (TPR) repeat protein
MAGNAGDQAAVRILSAEARTIYEEVGDSRGIAEASLYLGGAEHERNPERARDLLQESSQLFDGLGDERSALQSKAVLGRILTELGDVEQARALFDEGLEQARTLGEPRLEYPLLMGSAGIAIEEGRASDALALMKRSMLISRDVGPLLRVRIALGGIARALSMMGEAETAARLLACAEARGQEITGKFSWVSTRRKEETLASLREQLGEDALAEAWEQGAAMTLDEGVELALSAA